MSEEFKKAYKKALIDKLWYKGLITEEQRDKLKKKI